MKLSESWQMATSCDKVAGTGRQKRSIELQLGQEYYQLNIDEAKALKRELARMIASWEAAKP